MANDGRNANNFVRTQIADASSVFRRWIRFSYSPVSIYDETSTFAECEEGPAPAKDDEESVFESNQKVNVDHQPSDPC